MKAQPILVATNASLFSKPGARGRRKVWCIFVDKINGDFVTAFGPHSGSSSQVDFQNYRIPKNPTVLSTAQTKKMNDGYSPMGPHDIYRTADGKFFAVSAKASAKPSAPVSQPSQTAKPKAPKTSRPVVAEIASIPAHLDFRA